jgi:uncharacterized damage-inducible protein DinB/glutaredoxin
MSMQLQPNRSDVIEAYWIPGCTSCLRMKEFLEKNGVTYEPVNLEDYPERGERLKATGLLLPVVVIGDRAVSGLDLKAVAEFVGIDYDAPTMLPPIDLKRKYLLISATLCRLVAQMSPQQLEYKSPDRDRTLAALAAHVGTIMRAFLDAFDAEAYDATLEAPPEELRTKEAIVGWAKETEAMFERWWERIGHDDPLDRVIETYWGHHTMHEVLERAVWHPAQHTRQVALFMERIGLEPDGALTPSDLEGLPLPERIHA